MLVLGTTVVAGWGVLMAQTRPPAARPALAPDAQWAEVLDRWHAGEYPDALASLQQLLGGPAAATYLERAALLTGEWFVTAEITTDGRNPAIAFDGRHVTYESGPVFAPITRIAAVDGGAAKSLGEIRGGGAVFSPNAARLAWIEPPAGAEWDAAVATLTAGTASPAARTAAQAQLTWLLARDGTLTIRDLATSTQSVAATGTLLKGALAWTTSGLFMLGASREDMSRSDVYRIVEGAAPVRAAQSRRWRLFAIQARTTAASVPFSPASRTTVARSRSRFPPAMPRPGER